MTSSFDTPMNITPKNGSLIYGPEIENVRQLFIEMGKLSPHAAALGIVFQAKEFELSWYVPSINDIVSVSGLFTNDAPLHEVLSVALTTFKNSASKIISKREALAALYH